MAAAGLSEYITYGTVVRASQTVWACRHPADRLQKRQFRTANYELWLLLAQLPAHLQVHHVAAAVLVPDPPRSTTPPSN